MINIERKKLGRYSFILPVVVILLTITIFPLLYSLIISFFNLRLISIGGPTFAGISNYAEIIFRDERFWGSLYNTFSIAIPALVMEGVIGLLFALLLNRDIKGRRIITVLLILPVMIPPITTGLIWSMLYHEKYGAINGFLHLVGINTMYTWLSTPGLAKFAVILTDVWQWTPFVMMILLAGLQSIPSEAYEAAKVDGASSLQTFIHITLPLLKFSILVAILLRLIDLVKLFDIIFVLTRGGPGGTTETISIYTYLVSFRAFRMGYGAALSYLLLVITIAFSMVFIRLIRGKPRE